MASRSQSWAIETCGSAARAMEAAATAQLLTKGRIESDLQMLRSGIGHRGEWTTYGEWFGRNSGKLERTRATCLWREFPHHLLSYACGLPHQTIAVKILDSCKVLRCHQSDEQNEKKPPIFPTSETARTFANRYRVDGWASRLGPSGKLNVLNGS